MPNVAPHPCAVRSCPNLAEGNERYCIAHQKQFAARQDDERGTASQRGYGARWRKLRMMVLARNPFCADPYHIHGGQLVLATDVDHVVPKRLGGQDTFENLEGLCHSCHSRKTADEIRVGRGVKKLGVADTGPVRQSSSGGGKFDPPGVAESGRAK